MFETIYESHGPSDSLRPSRIDADYEFGVMQFIFGQRIIQYTRANSMATVHYRPEEETVLNVGLPAEQFTRLFKLWDRRDGS